MQESKLSKWRAVLTAACLYLIIMCICGIAVALSAASLVWSVTVRRNKMNRQTRGLFSTPIDKY